MKKLLLLAALALAAGKAAACYTVYDGNGRVLYQDVKPPVDMSESLRPAMEKRFGAGSHLVFEQANCRPLKPAEWALPRAGTPAAENTILWRGKAIPAPVAGQD